MKIVLFNKLHMGAVRIQVLTSNHWSANPWPALKNIKRIPWQLRLSAFHVEKSNHNNIKGLPLTTIYLETKQDSYAVFSTTIYNLFLAAAHISRMPRWETLHRYPLSLVSTIPIMTTTTTTGLAGGTKPGATTLTIRMTTIWAEDIKVLQRGIHLSNIKQPPN